MYSYICTYKKSCELNENSLVFSLFCFRFISAAVTCLSVLSFSSYLTPYFSVNYQKESFSTILSYYILSKLYRGSFPWVASSNLGATIHLTCDAINFC